MKTLDSPIEEMENEVQEYKCWAMDRFDMKGHETDKEIVKQVMSVDL